jgi:hypothetical protein
VFKVFKSRSYTSSDKSKVLALLPILSAIFFCFRVNQDFYIFRQFCGAIYVFYTDFEEFNHMFIYSHTQRITCLQEIMFIYTMHHKSNRSIFLFHNFIMIQEPTRSVSFYLY